MLYHDLLFEIGTEELPSGSVRPLAENLAANVSAGLKSAQLQFEEVEPFASPRRLAVRITNVQVQQATQHISRRGPSVSVGYDESGAPTKALLGFARSCGVDLDALQTVETDKGQWWAYECEQAGVQTVELLPTIIQDALNGLNISKPMRWGEGDLSFVRPVHWAILQFGEQFVTGFNVLGVPLGQASIGHRFHAPVEVVIPVPKLYEESLRAAYVVPSFETRRASIQARVLALAEKHGGVPIMPDDLLDEVTSIVEWPCPLLVPFPPKFLTLPEEVLIESMQSHQKCFALRDSTGALMPQFITVSNIDSQNAAQVVKGNAKVMYARLSDAAFFFEQDQKTSLEAHRRYTKAVTFQAELGSLADKANRIAILMENLSNPLQLQPEKAARAAYLSKCDLMTGMVGEFPELQGIMGLYYAQHDGEGEDVACALNEQYMPRFSKDDLPNSSLGLALSLADRVDTLIGLFAIGQKPSGVKDPFKLRRHALAVARLLMNISEPVSLSTILEEAYCAYGNVLPDDSMHATCQQVHDFILDRLVAFYQSQGIASDVVSAVLARQSDWLFDVNRRIQALKQFVDLPESAVLAATCRRVEHLLKRTDVGLDLIDTQHFEKDAEKQLHDTLQQLETVLAQPYLNADYAYILQQLSGLHGVVDDFFESVMVMVDNEQVKHNRLALLAYLQSTLQGVATISLLQHQGR